MNLKPGDLVWIVADASYIVRNEKIATKAVIVQEIPENWFRVYMSWGDKTKVVDLPKHMIRKISDDHR